MFSKRLV